MTIPKVIHYCWFGGGEKSPIIQKCIESWHEQCPDYEIMEWNEDNFDVNQVQFSRDAYNDKKWAFVSDYARLKIVYDHGGIYLDTDVLLKRNLDELLKYDCWLVSENSCYVIASGLGFGAIIHNYIIGKLLDYYRTVSYPSGTNTDKENRILNRLFPDLQRLRSSQLIESHNLFIVGCEEYDALAAHLGTLSWQDEKIVLQREKQINDYLMNPCKTSWFTLIKWKCLTPLRSPKIINFMNRRRFIGGIYIFCVYDLVEYGFFNFLKKGLCKLYRRFFRINKMHL